jgi:hypothetical protein
MSSASIFTYVYLTKMFSSIEFVSSFVCVSRPIKIISYASLSLSSIELLSSLVYRFFLCL